MKLPISPTPWSATARGEIKDARGLPVMWMCRGFDSVEDAANERLAAHSGELLKAAARFALSFNTHFGAVAESEVPAEFFTACGELVGTVLMCGVQIEAVTPAEGGAK